mgnify:CR=1 FL=1
MHDIGNVVIIDDNPNNLQVLSGILHDAGYKVRPALSGVIGLRAIAAQPPDLVLLDILMPELDGYETCRTLKENPVTADIPVIFISALNAIEDKLAGFHAGGVDYLTKPFQPEEVLARARTHIDLARTRRSLAESNARLQTLMEELVLAEKLRSLGALAAGVAHELNTPIGNALLAASTMEQTLDGLSAPPPEFADALKTCNDCAGLVMRSLERASQLIGTMKEMTVDRESERRRQIQLADTLRDFTEAMAIVYRNTPYTFRTEIPPNILLETHPGPLEQVLSNLVQNAVIHGFEHADAGTVSITLTEQNAEGVTLSIHDNGQGIAPENLNRVFDPFFTTKLGQGGSGLGLHIVYNITRTVLGGRISVSSDHTGTSFTLFLPWLAPEQSA